jgi:beta-lactamase superfamily II metal-dependent hydrolase
MKKTWFLRILAAMLCMLMLTALASCNTDGTENQTTEQQTTTAPEIKTLKINVEDYTLIRPDRCSEDIVSATSLFYQVISEKTGKKLKGFSDDFVRNESEISSDAYEILIGNTNRPESQEALKDVSYGYVVTKIGNKIVINATVPSLVPDAINYFMETYLSNTATDGTFEIPEDFYVCQSSDGSLILLDEKSKSRFTIIFADSLDKTKGTAESKDRTDWVVNCTMDFRNDLTKKFKDTNFPLGTDWVGRGKEPDSSAYEILVGRTNRPETQSFLESLAPNEYGYGVVGNKIIISGWSDLTIGLALDMFAADLDDYSFTDADGNKNLVLGANTKVVETYTDWNVNIPTYEGGVFTGVMEGGDTCYELYYTETNPDQYRAYRAKLEAAGYTLQQENQLKDNLFATYYNNDVVIHAYYVAYLSAVRVIVESMTTANLPQLEDPYTKITETTFTMMDLDYEAGNFGNAFIITLEDGSFIVHDGGGTSGQDKAELYNTLKRLNKRTDGKIVIAAWIISHEHWDHFENFFNFCNTYSTSIKLEQVIYNVSRTSINYNSYNPGGYVKNGNGSLKGLSILTKCKLTKFHTGQKIQIRNLTIECLYTQEDIYPDILHKFNDSCMVTRFDIGGQRFTILGDIEDEASAIMVNMYDTATLKTDILQVAHHGWGGTTRLYNMFKPTVLMWPTDANNFAGQTAGTSSGYYQTIDFALSKQANVKLIIVADGGHKTVSLPMTNISQSAVKIMQPTRK